MGVYIDSTITILGLALPCSTSDQELSPEGYTGYPNASENNYKAVKIHTEYYQNKKSFYLQPKTSAFSGGKDRTTMT